MSMQDPRALVVPNHLGDIDYQDLILHPLPIFSTTENKSGRYYSMIEKIKESKAS